MYDPDLIDFLDAIAAGDFERRCRRCGSMIRTALAEPALVRRGESSDVLADARGRFANAPPLFVLTALGAEVLR